MPPKMICPTCKRADLSKVKALNLNGRRMVPCNNMEDDCDARWEILPNGKLIPFVD